MNSKSGSLGSKDKDGIKPKRFVFRTIVARTAYLIAIVSLAAMFASIFPLAFADFREFLFPKSGYVLFVFLVASLVGLLFGSTSANPGLVQSASDTEISDIASRVKAVESRFSAVFIQEFNTLRAANETMKSELQKIEEVRLQERELELETLRKRNAELEKLVREYDTQKRSLHNDDIGVTASDVLQEANSSAYAA